MRIAIAGGTGAVGQLLASRAAAAGHDVLVLARSRGVDLVTGHGLDLRGVGTVVDVTGMQTLSAGKSRAFFTAVTERLLTAGREAGVSHHVALSIVGAARAPHGYYAGKAAQETLIEQGAVPWTILRSTQFFEFAEQTAVSIGPLQLHPIMRSQPVAADTVAQRLLELAEADPARTTVELAGPEEMRMAEVLRAVSSTGPAGRRVVEFALPGGFGRALRDGSILPGPDAELRGPSLAEWAASRAN